MKLFLGFEGYRAIAKIFCGVVLIFSFTGQEIFGGFYRPLLFVNIAVIFVSIFFMVIARYLEGKSEKY